ncbi:vasoactive intestinal polypeptide receptor 2-like [Oncorhynchus keta]|uniref:vasoactive intestinal polypeptide receptor 2-like n=1 Tax=Oncorhynchus keta TaxID=8018 RepID=UPI00227C14EA|nr:vasoactive intestinal polypeptide receptor 2-like [Oncorhynchus keta]XP_052355198.1 vasoactive intestinal polypeptide receptor 2-like [Oncorhynchus keta]
MWDHLNCWSPAFVGETASHNCPDFFKSEGLPMIVIVSWGLAKYFYEDEGCCETRVHDWVWWILRLPVLLFIIINLVFFLSILRILVGKLQMPDMHGNEFSQYKRLTKSTFLSVTLFGVYYILFAFLPIKVSGLTYKIWTFVELALASTQGFGVAVLYCFLNGEVGFLPISQNYYAI